jgi:hypothetical protein
MNLREAELYARVLMDWHAKFGANERGDAEYRQLVRSMSHRDFGQHEAQHELARLQVSGAWEWAYARPIPEDLWEHWCAVLEVSPQRPKSLGEAGRRLKELLASGEHRGEAANGERLEVSYSSREDLLQKARDFYQSHTREENHGIGGAAFLLSCSLERAGLPEGGGSITIISPEILGVREAPRGRQHDFLDAIRSGKLVVVEVKGSSGEPVHFAERPDEERPEERKPEEEEPDAI